MDLRLVIPLALCHVAWGRPQDLEGVDQGGLQDAINNLNLLGQLQIGESIVGDGSEEATPSQKKSGQPPSSRGRDSDGPFSDIPSDAFRLQHRKEFTSRATDRGRAPRKDPTGHPPRHRPRDEKVPESLIRTCLDYFRGRSRPERSSLELVLDICAELLDDRGSGEDFVLDDAAPPLHSRAPCECCPHAHARAPHAALLTDLVELFKPMGYRREWLVLNSKSPDQRMKTYVDLKK